MASSVLNDKRKYSRNKLLSHRPWDSTFFLIARSYTKASVIGIDSRVTLAVEERNVSMSCPLALSKTQR